MLGLSLCIIKITTTIKFITAIKISKSFEHVEASHQLGKRGRCEGCQGQRNRQRAEREYDEDEYDEHENDEDEYDEEEYFEDEYDEDDDHHYDDQPGVQLRGR